MERIKSTQKSDKKNANIVVLGIFTLRADLERGIESLKGDGFRNADISALIPTGSSSKEFAHEAGSKAPEGAAAGTASGALVGGILGWLVGIGSLAIPGVGPLIAAGPIMGMLAGVGVGGAVGGITGMLIGFGFPEYEAKRYEGQIREGGYLVSVHCDNSAWAKKAREILESCGARDISDTRESAADFAKSDRPVSLSGNA